MQDSQVASKQSVRAVLAAKIARRIIVISVFCVAELTVLVRLANKRLLLASADEAVHLEELLIRGLWWGLHILKLLVGADLVDVDAARGGLEGAHDAVVAAVGAQVAINKRFEMVNIKHFSRQDRRQPLSVEDVFDGTLTPCHVT